METNRLSPDPKPKDRKENPTNQNQVALAAEVTDSSELSGARPAPSAQDPDKQQQGAERINEVTGKQVDDYFADSGDSSLNEQLN